MLESIQEFSDHLNKIKKEYKDYDVRLDQNGDTIIIKKELKDSEKYREVRI